MYLWGKITKIRILYWNECDKVEKYKKGKLIKDFCLINTYNVVLKKSRNEKILDLIETLKDL